MSLNKKNLVLVKCYTTICSLHSVLKYVTHKKFTLEQKDKNQPINFKYQLYLMSLGFVQRALEKTYFYCIIVPKECKNVQI